MEAGLTQEECVALVQFALRAFSSPLGASAVLAVARARKLDDALLDEAAGEHAAAWRGFVPENDSDPLELVRLGWQAPVHDPDVIAALVLLRPQPVSIAAVKGLLAVAKLGGNPVEDRLARRAGASLAEMENRVLHFKPDAPDHRVMEPWDPEALEALSQHDPDPALLWAACKWLVAAFDASMQEGWEQAAFDATRRLVEERVRSEESHRFGALPVPGLNDVLARLLESAPLESALHWLGSDSAKVRRAALARARQVSPGAREEVVQYLRSLVERRGWTEGRLSAVRGALGIFEGRDQWGRAPPALGSPEQLEWCRQAGEHEVISAALQVVSRSRAYAVVRDLVEPDHVPAFERALIERFEAAPPKSSEAGALADGLADLGTAGAMRALVGWLSREGAVAMESERALSQGHHAAVVDRELLVLSAGPDPSVALRATRALAARATPAAQERFEELALTGSGLLRWIAFEALGRLGPQSRSCEVLREALRRATPHEEQVILAVLPRCAQTPHDVAWTLELPVRAELEEALSHCTAMLVAASLPEEEPEVLDRLAQLLVEEPHRILRWNLDEDRVKAVVALLTRHLLGHDPAHHALGAKLDEIVNPPVAMRGPRVVVDVHEPSLFSEQLAGAESGAAPAVAPPPAPPRLAEAACFSVLAPECVAPGDSFILEIFVHSKAARDTLAQWSSQERARRFTAGPRALASGCSLDVAVSIEGIRLPYPTGQVLWDGDLGMVQFPVTLPVDALSPTYPGRAAFNLDGIKIAESHFLITLGPVVGARSKVAPTQQVIRSAFASYATADRPAVLARIQGMQQAAPFIEIFLDVVLLRSGDDWAERIRSEIKARDVLLLFWSQAASKSRYVDTEWRMALAENGIERISLVPLEDAARAPPPPELGSLDFNMPPPVQVFISYAPADATQLDRIEVGLKPLVRAKRIATFSARDVRPGDEPAKVIATKLRDADLILLLVSSDFLASDACHDIELHRAIERHENGDARVIPIFVRPTDVTGQRFAEIQGLPRHVGDREDLKPITSFEDQDVAHAEIASRLRSIVNEMAARSLRALRSALLR